MNQQHYNGRITAAITARQAFNGINNVQAWWAQNLEGSSQNINDTFITRFGETFGEMKVTEMVPGKKIVWHVVDCYLGLLKNKKEWKGTNIVFDIEEKNGSTEISMTHVGLLPALECYEDCTKGWDFFIKESLLQFLTKDAGQPGTGIRATIANGGRLYRGTLFSKNSPAPDLASRYLYVDVKETRVEHVVSAYSVNYFNPDTFDAATLKGDYFMLIEDKPLYDGVKLLDDLMATVE